MINAATRNLAQQGILVRSEAREKLSPHGLEAFDRYIGLTRLRCELQHLLDTGELPDWSMDMRATVAFTQWQQSRTKEIIRWPKLQT